MIANLPFAKELQQHRGAEARWHQAVRILLRQRYTSIGRTAYRFRKAESENALAGECPRARPELDLIGGVCCDAVLGRPLHWDIPKPNPDYR